MEYKGDRKNAKIYQTMELMSNSQGVYLFARLFHWGRELIFLVIIQNHKPISLCYRSLC